MRSVGWRQVNGGPFVNELPWPHKGRYIHSQGTNSIRAKDNSIRERAPSFANLSCRHDWSSKRTFTGCSGGHRCAVASFSSLSLLTTERLISSFVLYTLPFHCHSLCRIKLIPIWAMAATTNDLPIPTTRVGPVRSFSIGIIGTSVAED